MCNTQCANKKWMSMVMYDAQVNELLQNKIHSLAGDTHDPASHQCSTTRNTRPLHGTLAEQSLGIE